MPGGLLQIASSGVQDSYLTGDPQITFFKKIYRRHTNFSMQTIEVSLDHTPDFGQSFFINLPNNGDLIHRCFFEITIPKLNINDNSITNTDYINIKKNKLRTIDVKTKMWKKEYDSLSGFSNIQIEFYRKLNILLKSSDINFQNILNLGIIEKNRSSVSLEAIIFTIDEALVSKLDIIGYVINLNKTFGTTNSEINKTITYDTFVNNVNILYRNNIYQLKYYHSNYIYNKKEYEEVNLGEIKYSWIKNLGHHYFTNYELELDGRIIENYSSDYLNIHQSHNLTDDMMKNYDEMIGNVSELNKIDSNKKDYTLYVPLIFWFNRSSTYSLPLVAMSNSSAKINVDINDLTNLIYFEDYKYEYDNLVKYKLSFNDHVKNTNNLTIKGLDYTNSNVSYSDFSNIEYLQNERLYIYNFKTITKELIALKFPSLSSNVINKFFTNYSSDGINITYSEYLAYRINLPQVTDVDIKQISKYLHNYNYSEFSDYNLYLSKVGQPQIKFYAEYVFLDEVERFKFAKNELEYVVNLPNQITTVIGNQELYSSDVNILRPTKDLIWAIRPILTINGLNKYSKKDPNIYNQSLHQDDKIIDNLVFMVQDNELINFKFGENFYLYTTKYDKLNRIDDNTFYYFSFCLHPENDQPSGSVNFSAIKGKSILIKLNKEFLVKYFNTSFNKNLDGIQLLIINRTYNLLRFSKGKGAQVFY